MLRLKSVRQLDSFRSAPPHGGRLRKFGLENSIDLFRSAPPHGGRHADTVAFLHREGFDPRPRTGGDNRHVERHVHQGVSIRAPARGATARPGACVPDGRFRSAPPHGGRRGEWDDETGTLLFRSAPPHGGRRRARAWRGHASRFDPRPRTGGDPCHRWEPLADGAVSIRAPARGATRYRQATAEEARVFRSAPPHGGRRARGRTPSADARFDPRPRTGGDKPPKLHAFAVAQFRSAPPHGGRP